MAKENGRTGGPTGLDELRNEFGDLLSGLAQQWTEKASDKVAGLTDRLTDVAEGVTGSDGSDGPGGLLGIGGRMLHGDSPLKAMVGQKTKDAKDKVFGKVKGIFSGGGKGGGKGGKGGSVKAINIVETLDVGVPIRTVYDQWTQFEDFGSFTKGVRSVSKSEDTESDWNVKVGPSSRSWKSTIQEQVPDERIVWTSEGAKGSTDGAVSFHELGPSLTRILLVVEYHPAGFFEKTGNLWRAGGRRMRLDLKHFGRHVTLHADEEIEGWRGEIRDGEVVRSHEDALAAEEDEYDEEYGPEDEEGTEEAEEDEEDEEGEESEDEYEPEAEDEEEAEEPEDEEAEDERLAGRRRR
jgi:Polyketide cyclase / dehydrase and lipid transport